MRTLEVGLAGRAYDVKIGTGLLGQAGGMIAPMLARPRTVVVTDENVAELHGEELVGSLRASGVQTDLVVMAAGEQTKSFEGLAELSDRLLSHELDRKDMVVALGGGVIGDLTGFAAAIYKRGVDFIQVPTTLLAQVDSSVGGKTAIDTPQGKNLIGAFHQPRLVVADLGVLSSLPDRQMAAGFGEVLKYGLLGDGAFFNWLEAHGHAVLAHDPAALEHVVVRCVEMKAEIVAADERETNGGRALLNLGHTFGHALEAETGFGEALLHGEAVALGCAMAFRFSVKLGLCDPEAASRVEGVIGASGLPRRMDEIDSPAFSSERLLGHMLQDKKAEAGRPVLVLARRIGEAFNAPDVDVQALRSFLIEEGATP
jgi:3-dehydroquinate synthase